MQSRLKAAGVTLLEIMLVLAVAAMVIVMSIRYYQSASTSQQVNMAMSQIQAITAAADNLAIGTGSYLSSATASNIKAVIGSANFLSPTGGTVTVTPSSASKYAVTIPLNKAICTSVAAKLKAIAKITQTGTCDAGTLSYEYDNAK